VIVVLATKRIWPALISCLHIPITRGRKVLRQPYVIELGGGDEAVSIEPKAAGICAAMITSCPSN
jgi:hypothetical protein